MQLTGSISRGKPAEKHNTRECYRDREHTPENIDRSRSDGNAVLVNRGIEDVYRETFGAATDEYNAKQVVKGHPERQIPDYLAKVRADKKLHPMYEFVVQVGNMDEHPDADTAKRIYSEWLDGFSERFGAQFVVKQAIVHVDEATPHMHLEVVPRAESGRGLSVQNSLNKAIRQAGFSDYKAMLAGWDELLTEVMGNHAIERVAGDRERQMGGVDIDTYRRSIAAQEAAEAAKRSEEQARERLECLRREIEVAEPASQTLAESARTVWTARKDGKREKGLGSEVEGLRERVSGLKRDVEAARGRIAELESGNPGLIERRDELERSVEAARKAFGRLKERVRGYLANVGEHAAALLQSLGVRAYAGNPPPSEVEAEARVVATGSFDQPRRAPQSAGIDLDIERADMQAISQGMNRNHDHVREGVSL